MTHHQITDICIPRETVNDDMVLIASWRVVDGTHVEPGQVIAEVETSKSVIEITADRAGSIQILHNAQTEIPIGEPIARISSDVLLRNGIGDVAGTVETAVVASSVLACVTENTSASNRPLFSEHALSLMEQHGMSRDDFAGLQMVTGASVRGRLSGIIKAGSGEEDRSSGETASVADDPCIAFSAAKARWQEYGPRGLFGDASASAQHRGRGVWWLVLNYFWRNWLLGLVARVAPRGLNLVVHRLRGVRIGKDCFIDPTAILETAYPDHITLGDDVRVAAGAILMAHIKAPDLLRESGAVPPVVSCIELRDHCFIGVNACIMPGVVVGEGAVVSSGAVVLANVAAYTMVAGNPAQLVKTLRPRG